MNPQTERERTLTPEQIQHGLDEIKGMREEINWRVKVAYNSSLIFLSVIAFTIGTLFNSENKFLEAMVANPDLKIQVGLVLIVLISAWVGVQNANHIIEKRIELYSLSVYQLISSSSGKDYFGWVGFLYGSRFFPGKINTVAKVLNASIGLFIYFLPNAIGLVIWGNLMFFDNLSGYTGYFLVSTVFLLIAIGTSALLFAYVIRLNKQSSTFFEERMTEFDHLGQARGNP